VNVLFVTSEVAPLAKTGGLADVSAALPAYLTSAGHDVRTFVPFYGTLKTDGLTLTVVIRELELRLGPHRYAVSIVLGERAGAAPVYLVNCPALFHRASIYTNDNDEHLRFLVLSRAALDACQLLGFTVDIVHCNDWQASLLPLLVKTRYMWDQRFARAKSLLTIHNLQYQGGFPASILPDTGLADSAHLFHQDQLRAGRLSFLWHGILYADGISTVSPTYANEIQRPELGAGLDPLLRERSSSVVGILNGVDYDEWSPERDRLIPSRFDVDDLTGKARCKQALLAKLGLPHHERVPVIGIVSRLAGQKGFALLESTMPALLRAHGFQLVVLGSGESRFETLFGELARAFPAQVAFYRGFSNELAHLIEAGADMFLMPSVYEPCGLNQMYSLRYGTVPIVHATGGLADTVELWDPETRRGNGISFARHDPAGLVWAIEAALQLYRDPATWRKLIDNGMRADFSWQRQGKLYELVYERLLAQPAAQGG
jgi:starch synthase